MPSPSALGCSRGWNDFSLVLTVWRGRRRERSLLKKLRKTFVRGMDWDIVCASPFAHQFERSSARRRSFASGCGDASALYGERVLDFVWCGMDVLLVAVLRLRPFVWRLSNVGLCTIMKKRGRYRLNGSLLLSDWVKSKWVRGNAQGRERNDTAFLNPTIAGAQTAKDNKCFRKNAVQTCTDYIPCPFSQKFCGAFSKATVLPRLPRPPRLPASSYLMISP